VLKVACFDLMDTLVEMPIKPQFAVYGTLGFSSISDFDDCAQALTIEHLKLDPLTFFSLLFEARNLPVDQEAIAIADKQWRHAVSRATFVEGAVEAIAAVKDLGLRVSLLSNCYPPTCYLIDGMKLHEHFDVMTLSYEVGAWKPSQGIFKSALSALNVHSSEACMIGNKISTDIVGAVESGLIPILLQSKSVSSHNLEIHSTNVNVIADLIKLDKVIKDIM